jgi:hypothetical protein
MKSLTLQYRKKQNMDIQLAKEDIIKRFQQVTDESLILAVKDLLDFAQGQKGETKEDIFTKYTDADMVARAERSELDIAEGRTITMTQFKENVENWKKEKRLNTK